MRESVLPFYPEKSGRVGSPAGIVAIPTIVKVKNHIHGVAHVANVRSQLQHIQFFTIAVSHCQKHLS